MHNSKQESVVMLRRPFLAALAAAALWMSAGMPASAQFSTPFGRDAVALTPAEREAMDRTILEVLQSGKAGTARSWKNDDTKRSGTATLLKAYTSGNAKCGEVRHTFARVKPGERAASYTMPFCQQPDGSWKIAF